MDHHHRSDETSFLMQTNMHQHPQQSPHHDERSFLILKRKLATLKYTEHLDNSSCALVARLVDDLIRTTESYQSLKVQEHQKELESNAFRSKAEALKKDCARAIKENNALHVQIIQQAEQHNEQQMENYQRVKELEKEISELSFWKHQAQSRLEATEKENASVKERLKDVMNLGTKGHPVTDHCRLTASASAGECDSITCNGASVQKANVLAAVEERLLQVQSEAKGKEQDLEKLRGEAHLLQLSIKDRDAEIKRLADKVESGAESDMSTLAARNESNEAIILSLNEQVEVLTSQLTSMEQQADAVPMLRKQLQTATAQHEECELKLHDMVEENKGIQEQVTKLQHEVKRIRTESARKGKQKQENRNVLAQVENLQTELTAAQGGQEEMKMKAHAMDMKLEDATRKEGELKGELQRAKEQVSRLQLDVQKRESKVEAQQEELLGLREDLGKLQVREKHLIEERTALQERESQLQIQLTACQAKFDLLESKCKDLRQEVISSKSLQSTTSRAQTGLQQQLEQVTAEKQRLESKLASISDDRGSVQEQLQEAVRAKTSAQASLMYLEADKERLTKELQLCQDRYEQCKAQLAESERERNQFELSATKSERELAVVQEERTVLQEDLMRSRKQWQDHRERLMATEGELGHLSGIRDRSEALQAELTSALSRLAATESECSELRGDVERWQGAAGESDDKALSLQNSLREAERKALEQGRALSDCKKECESLAAQISTAESTQSVLQIDLEQCRVTLQCREEALAGERAKVQDMEFKMRSIEHQSEGEKQRLTVKDEELRRLKTMLDEAEGNVQTWQEKHRDVVAELRMVADKSRQHEVLSEDYKNDLDNAWAQLEEEKRNNGDLTEQVQKLKGQLATCNADVEQLKSLALAGSRSQSELESKIVSQAAEIREAQSTIQKLNDSIHQQTEVHDKSMHELADAQAVIQRLDAERDRLQSELDEKAEALAALEQQHRQATGTSEELSHIRQRLEQQMAQADSHIKHLEQELQREVQRGDVTKQNLVAAQQDYEHLREETAALSDDLAVMVKENQAITSQLGDALQRADECRRDGDATHASVSILQQTVKARELELADFRAAYEGLVAESRASDAAIAQLKRQLGGCSTELEGAKAEIAHLREASHSTQLQLQQYVVDVQALERNSDVLTRELQTAKSEAEDLAKDRNRVLEQSQAVQSLRYEAERARDGLQREAASLDSQLHISNARLNEAHTEIRNLTGRHVMLQNRIEELEKVIEHMRAQEFRSQALVAQEQGSDPGTLLSVQQKCDRLELEASTAVRQLDDAQKQIAVLQSQVQCGSRSPCEGGDGSDLAMQHWRDKLAVSEAKATAAEQELAISRRQLERLQAAQRTRLNAPSATGEDESSQLRIQIQELTAEKDELQQRASTLQHDKERLLGMVSRLELEKHTLENSMRSEEAY